jgi:hypothetical protein
MMSVEWEANPVNKNQCKEKDVPERLRMLHTT